MLIIGDRINTSRKPVNKPWPTGTRHTLRATAVLLGQDPWCQAYTGAFREGKLET
jgi:hypothetical protein